MSQTIEIETLARLDVRPGEILVAAVPLDTTDAAIDEIHTTLREGLPPGVHCMIITGDIKLGVVATAEWACRECGCTDAAACTDDDGQPCAWVELDLCTACVDSAPLVVSP